MTTNVVADIVARATELGMVFEIEDSKMQVRSKSLSSIPDDLLNAIRKHKVEIERSITKTPKTPKAKPVKKKYTLESYLKRLKGGADHLTKCWQSIQQNKYSETSRQFRWFRSNLFRWVDIEDALRKDYPEFDRCPVGKCRDETPVRCLYCGR
tara:strand:- start:418 stop:876 length:459 start_codon:yes stop_codon:yes gene_type:complete